MLVILTLTNGRRIEAYAIRCCVMQHVHFVTGAESGMFIRKPDFGTYK